MSKVARSFACLVREPAPLAVRCVLCDHWSGDNLLCSCCTYRATGQTVEEHKVED